MLDTIKTHTTQKCNGSFETSIKPTSKKAITGPSIRKKLNKKKNTPKILMIVAEINNRLGLSVFAHF